MNAEIFLNKIKKRLKENVQLYNILENHYSAIWSFSASFLGDISPYAIFMFHLICIRSTWNFKIFSDFQKVDSRKCRTIEKYAMYEAKIFWKVVSKQKTNLKKVSGVYVKRVKICGKKLRGRVKDDPPGPRHTRDCV